MTPISTYRFDGLFKLLMKRLSVRLGGVSESEVIRICVADKAKELGIQ